VDTELAADLRYASASQEKEAYQWGKRDLVEEERDLIVYAQGHTHALSPLLAEDKLKYSV
jgi:hypothetical protein